MKTKVVKIISETEVVLGAGANQGVLKGMDYIIYEPCEEIFDPETGDSLGHLEIVKGHVKVDHVMPGICIAKTNHRTETRICKSPLTGFSAALAASALYGTREIEVKVGDKLQVNENDKDEQYSTADRTVKVGDRARSIS